MYKLIKQYKRIGIPEIHHWFIEEANTAFPYNEQHWEVLMVKCKEHVQHLLVLITYLGGNDARLSVGLGIISCSCFHYLHTQTNKSNSDL